MPQEFKIRRMTLDEMKLTHEWVRQEGWNPGLQDSTCFYAADPKGFFIGLLGDQPIVIGSAVVYDDQYAFCGHYIVKPEYRHQGYGLLLTKERLNYVGDRITGLDGVLNMAPIYERLGYVPFYQNIRYEITDLNFDIKTSRAIVDLNTVPFNELTKFDRHYFPAPRTDFLHCWIKQSTHRALGYVDENGLQGYGVIRQCIQGHKIGPLFAANQAVADDILHALLSKVSSGPVFIDVPEPNQQALDVVKEYNVKQVFAVVRMYRNGKPNQDLAGIYGITSPELG